jgi:predicted nucleic acid-binding protein
MPKITKEVHGELCDLLSGISGVLELCKGENLTEKQKQYVEEMLKALTKMRTLLNGSLKNSGTFKSIEEN